jgi:hypothetical protein
LKNNTDSDKNTNLISKPIDPNIEVDKKVKKPKVPESP